MNVEPEIHKLILAALVIIKDQNLPSNRMLDLKLSFYKNKNDEYKFLIPSITFGRTESIERLKDIISDVYV